jgi:hypothetical protein
MLSAHLRRLGSSSQEEKELRSRPLTYARLVSHTITVGTLFIAAPRACLPVSPSYARTRLLANTFIGAEWAYLTQTCQLTIAPIS